MENQGTLRIWWRVSSLTRKMLTAALILAAFGAAVGYYFWIRGDLSLYRLIAPLFFFGFLLWLIYDNSVRQNVDSAREEEQLEREEQERRRQVEERRKGEILLIEEALGVKEVEIKSDIGEIRATRFEFTDDGGVEQEGLIDNYGDIYRLWIRE